MKRLALLVALAACALAPAAARADWTAAGGALNISTDGGSGSPSTATIGGVPYVAWDEHLPSDDDAVYVKHWTGTKWVLDGNALNINPSDGVGDPSIASVDGTPYVTWAEQPETADTVIYAARWSGTGWQQVGSGAVNSDLTHNAGQPKIAGVGATPYVTWDEPNGTADQVYVAHFSAGAWHQDGGSLNIDPTQDAEDPDIADVGSVPYVVWTEDSASLHAAQVYVAHLGSGDTWVDDGGSLNVNPDDDASNEDPSLASVGGLPTVAWNEQGVVTFARDAASPPDTSGLYVKQLIGATWVQDGGPIAVNGVAESDDPAVADIGGRPYLALVASPLTVGSSTQVDVVRWDGTAWNVVGGVVNQGDERLTPAITDVGGVPFVAWGSIPPATTTSVNRNEEILIKPVLHVSLLTPSFSSEQAISTDNGALLAVRARDYGTSLPIGFQYGRGSSLGTSTTPVMTGGTGSDTIIQAISGLSPSTRYSWRAYATDGSVDTAVGPTHIFRTEAASTTGPKGKAGKIEVVTCRQTHSHGVTVEQCTGKLVSTPVEVAAEQIRAGRLSRGERLYATVEVLRGRDGRMRLLIVHRVRRLSRGSYTLRTRSGRTTVRLS